MSNIFKQHFEITQEERKERNGHKAFVVWFTGLSGSGKSTLADAIEYKLFMDNVSCFSLDGDNVRFGLNQDLGFSAQDRKENLRRIAEVAKLMNNAGLICIASFISPLESDRDLVRQIIGQDRFVEVFVDTPLEECERRDVKGLYAKARRGEIDNFTGISAPYEPPIAPDIQIDTTKTSLEKSVDRIYTFIKEKM